MVAMAPPVEAASLRLRHEFRSAPTLSLTVAQVARFLDIQRDHAAAILDTFIDEGWLVRAAEGQYRPREAELLRLGCARPPDVWS